MTAAQALGAAGMLQGSVVQRAMQRPPTPDAVQPDANTVSFSFQLAHPKGIFPVGIGVVSGDCELFPRGVPSCAKYTTTVRPIAEGRAFID